MRSALYLASAWLAQHVVVPGIVRWESVAAQVGIIVGVLIAASVPILPHLAVLIVAGVGAGVGRGVADRCAMRIVSATGQPGTHARAVSRCAAIAYLCAAVTIVGVGVIANAASMSVAVFAGAVLLAVIAGATVSFHVLRARSSESTVRATQSV